MQLFDRPWPFSGSASSPSNHQALAENNRRVILGLICRRKSFSQKNLAAKTKLQASTVSNIVRYLKSAGFVEDGSALKADRVGPKETILEIVPGYRWSVGISLDEQHRLVVMNAVGHVIVSAAFPAGCSVPDLIQELPRRLEELARQWRLDWSRFAGIGVSVPGVVEPKSGVVMLSRLLREEGYPLRERMESALRVPVLVERNVVCGAYAERVAGGASDAESFLYLSITSHEGNLHGFGLATVVDEKIFRGNHSAAGEIDFLMDQFVSPAKLDKRRADHMDTFYSRCGEGIAAILNLQDISRLILACDDKELTEKRFSLLNAALLKRLVPMPDRKFNLARSPYQVSGSVHGAALLVLHHGMEDDLRLSKGETVLTSNLPECPAVR